MLKRYSIWDKVSPVITPSGEIFSAEDWMNRYPVARLDNIIVVGSAGEINGAYFGTLGQMIQNAQAMSCEFYGCETAEDYLERIEEFEDAMNQPPEDNGESTPEERIAAALEFQNMLAMPTINTDDPDLD